MSYTKCDDKSILATRNFQLFLDFLTHCGHLVTPIDDYGLLYKIDNGSSIRFQCGIDLNTSGCSALLKDKLLTYLALEQLGINIPKGAYFLRGNHRYSQSIEDITVSLTHLEYPLIIKPNDSSLGKGITVLWEFDEEHVQDAILTAQQYSDVILAQEYLVGDEYRIIAIQGEIIFILRKFPKPKSPIEVPVSVDDRFLPIVSRSMMHLGITVCGFDIIATESWIKVLEMNSNPYIYQIKDHLSQSSLETYFNSLENLLRRNYGY